MDAKSNKNENVSAVKSMIRLCPLYIKEHVFFCTQSKSNIIVFQIVRWRMAGLFTLGTWK